MADALVRALFDGPLDVVGDIHGEIDALCCLMHQLGYRDDGSHPEGRHLIFLGDLTDRGPDSPAVVDLVRRLVDAGRAQCVLGNHDLNLLLGHRKFDNGWFFGEEFRHEGQLVPQKLAFDDRTRQSITDFFRTLPLGLERSDLRVVHACWEPAMVEIARTASGVLALYHRFSQEIDADLQRRDLDEIGRSLERQNRNPVKVLTSGLERRAEQPFESSGTVRHEERVRWWTSYGHVGFCVFGHYGIAKGDGPIAGRAICTDFGVGNRWKERKEVGFDGHFRASLGATRFPEAVLVFDDGATEQITS